MKKKFLLLFLTIVSVVCLAFGISACSGEQSEPWYGSYTSLLESNGTIIIDKDNFTWGSSTYSYTVDEENQTISYGYADSTISLTGHFFDNYNLLCLAKYSSSYCSIMYNSQKSRDGYVSARIMFYSTSGQIEDIIYLTDSGTYNWLSDDTSNCHSGTYTLKNGVLITNGYYIISGNAKTTTNYISEDFVFYSALFFKDVSVYIPSDEDNSETENSESSSTNDNTDYSDTGDTEQNENTYSLTYTATTGGSINGEISQTVNEGESGSSVTAIANTGYIFTGWSDGVTTATRTDTNVTANISITAQFELQTFTVTYTATTGGSISGETSQTVTYGGNGLLVTAVAEDGYEFMGWSDGVTTYYRQDSNITSDISVTALFEETDTVNFAGGSGTINNPYKISTAEHLINIKLYSSACYVLINDITLTTVADGESNFTSLFDEETMFTGTLNGNGYTIYNLSIYNTNTYYTGLFACIGSGGVVKNLTLENVNISGTNYIGGIAAYSLGEITDCAVTGDITYLSQNSYKVFIGAVTGRTEGTLINNCTANISIKAENIQGESYIGGIAGYYYYYTNEKSFTFSSNVNINISCENSVYTGGLFGYIERCYISNSYSTGDINILNNSSAYGSIVGGIAGTYDNSSKLVNSYSTVNITIEKSYGIQAGGLIGYFSETLLNCYYSGDISVYGTEYVWVGGLTGYCGGQIGYSYSLGNIIAASEKDTVCVGGLAGYFVSSNNGNVFNCYTTSKISATGKTLYAGGIVGYTTSGSIISNSHWLYYNEGAADYAVGYSRSLGIPTNIGATKHTDISDFYTLAATLNGDGETVWENKDSASLPTLIDTTTDNS